ncbi:unnamed protein product [Symbiodinium sp. CCMP2456]|nr:unnamed protein product [Symbiodinium sp. CCMP2456]
MDAFSKKLSQPVLSSWSSNVQDMLRASDDPKDFPDTSVAMLRSKGERCMVISVCSELDPRGLGDHRVQETEQPGETWAWLGLSSSASCT